MRGPKDQFPVMLSNGNLVSERNLDNGLHEAHWQDPFPKPSYLFALVAADLGRLEETITTASGRKALLQVYTRSEDLGQADFALQSLKRAIFWDEQRFGLELDLERFMIVAVPDFNSGAMENKGLNLFNTKYVLVADKTGIQPKENPFANGPAWFVSEVKIAGTPNEEIDLISKVDNKKVAVIGKEDEKYLNGKTLQADPAAKIAVKTYQPNEIVYQTSSATPQLAVMSEIYYPHGWKFYIDGKETDYIKADYLLRAVHVPSGKHEIRMAFEPEVIQKGKTISLASAGLFILLAALGFWFYQRKEQQTTKSEK
jgi:hypothetical protein